MRTSLKKTDIRVSVSVLAVVVAVLTAVPAQAQRRADRRSGPHDWSHGRVIATQFAPDLDRSLAKNWRTTMKHADLDRARARRNPDGDRFQTPQQRRETEQRRTEAPHLDWNLRTGGYGSVVGYPAKYNFDIATSNCSDVIYFTVDQAGSASAVNVIGITNPYAGCPGNPTSATPTVKFGIRMGTGTATSAVPSLDGNILYVLESRSRQRRRDSSRDQRRQHHDQSRHVQLLDAGLVERACSGRAHRDSDERTAVPDHIRGRVEQSGVHLSRLRRKPTVLRRLERTRSPGDQREQHFGVARPANFPVSCGTAALQSPVFVNGQVIVTSADGRLYRIDTTKAPPYTCIASAQGGAGTGGGVSGGLSAPVVDVTNGKILVTTNNDAMFGLAGIGTFNLMFASQRGRHFHGASGHAVASFAPSSPSFDDAFWTMGNGNVYAAGSPTAWQHASGSLSVQRPDSRRQPTVMPRWPAAEAHPRWRRVQ